MCAFLHFISICFASFTYYILYIYLSTPLSHHTMISSPKLSHFQRHTSVSLDATICASFLFFSFFVCTHLFWARIAKVSANDLDSLLWAVSSLFLLEIVVQVALFSLSRRCLIPNTFTHTPTSHYVGLSINGPNRCHHCTDWSFLYVWILSLCPSPILLYASYYM